MFELVFPWILCLLPLPFLITVLLPRVPIGLSTALKIPFYTAVSEIADSQKSAVIRQKSYVFFYLIGGLLLLALSGPRWVGTPIPLTREGYNIMLALDLSGSMEVPDMTLNGRPASRLAVVKKAAVQFVNDRIGDQIGLILFGSHAYLQTPLTYDRQNVLLRLEDASVGLAGKTTSIGDALGLAIKRLQNVPKKSRVIILLTDGVNNSGVIAPLKAAELARSENIKVYTIGLGPSEQVQTMGGLFINVSADLDEATLKEVAKITGGRYFRATDLASLQMVYQMINEMEKTKHEQATIRPQYDYYAWPLGVALILCCLWCLREYQRALPARHRRSQG